MAGIKILINIDVDDPEVAAVFYQEVLGFERGRRLRGEGIELLGAGCNVYLLKQPVGTPPFAGTKSKRSYGRHWTPVHLDCVIENLEQGVTRAMKAGAKAEGGISTHPWGRMQLMADPWGHGFCLLQFNEKGYDAIRID